MSGASRPSKPAGEVTARHAVTDLEPCDLRPDCNDLTRSVAKRNDVWFRWQRIGLLRDHHVTSVDRSSMNPDHDFSWPWRWIVALTQYNAINPSKSF